MATSPFRLHTSQLSKEGCPLDPTSPVPPPDGFAGEASNPGSAGVGPTSEIGAMLGKWARNPNLRPYEQVFRIEPNEAWFDVSRDPDHPTQFEIGAARPERGQSILLMDYSVIPYTFSGVTAFDFSPLEDDMISGAFGYSIRINDQEPGNLSYQLQPIPSTIRQQSLRFNQSKIKTPSEMSSDDFDISQASTYAAAAGYGTGLHLQNSQHYGARGVPFTEWIHDDEVVKVMGVVFHQVDIPLAFVQVTLSGFKCASQIVKEIQEALRSALR